MKFIYLTFLLLIISFDCSADVYTEVDKNGTTVFSDVPLSDKSKRITELNQTSTVESATSATTEQPTGTKSTRKKEIKKPYTTFVMSSPVDQATIQNQPTISVAMNVQPALQAGDKIQIYLDGIPWGAPLASTNFSFPAPDRGTHTISAKLIDSNGITLNQTNAVTVYIHHAHL